LASWSDPITVGDIRAPNLLVMSALTRLKADKKTGIPNDLMAEYYS